MLTLYPKECFLTNFVNIIEGRAVVVGPMVVADSVAEVTLSIIGVPLRCVYDPVLFAMSLIQVGGDVLNWVTVHRLDPT